MFVKRCKQNVYSGSEISREEVESLIVEREGKLCTRFFRRSDGSLMTRDCPKLPGLIMLDWAGLSAMQKFALEFPFCFPVFCYLMTWFMAPGYIVPFVHHPVGLAALLTMFGWNLIGSCLLWRFRNLDMTSALYVCIYAGVLLIFMCPLLLVPMIGPSSTGTIMQVNGPVLTRGTGSKL